MEIQIERLSILCRVHHWEVGLRVELPKTSRTTMVMRSQAPEWAVELEPAQVLGPTPSLL